MNQADLKKDWLAGNSVVALGGALLLAQSWRLSGGGVELPFVRTIPDVLDVFYVAIVSSLLVSSLALAAASVLSPVRSWALRKAVPFVPALGFFVWVSFVLSLLSANAALPDGQVWAKALSAGGAVMSAFIAFTMVVNPLLRMILGRR